MDTNGDRNDNSPEDVETRLMRLPPEIWAKIFNYLTDPRDKVNAINSYSLWSAVLHTQKTEFLFPMVLPCLINSISAVQLVRFRGVCNLWLHSVDYLLENGPHYRNPSSRQRSIEPVPSTSAAAAVAARALRGNVEQMPLFMVPRSHPIFAQTTITFTKVQDVINFIQRMENTGLTASCKNPFPGRSVRFSPTTGRVHVAQLISFEAQMRRLMMRHGKHVWRFQYKLPVHETPTVGRNMLIRLLECLPNLKILHFEDGCHWLNWRGVAGEQLMPEERLMAQLVMMHANILEEALPFPRLHQLEELRCPRGSLFHGEQMNNIVSAYTGQIRNVEWINENSAMSLRLEFRMDDSRFQEERRNRARNEVQIEEVEDEESDKEQEQNDA